MQILSAAQMQTWDKYTIQHEPISSLDLMERAAGKCAEWLARKPWQKRTFNVFCGRGNNGGDGLVIACCLLTQGFRVQTFLLHSDVAGAPDFENNQNRLKNIEGASMHFIRSAADLPALSPDDIIVDALFGTGFKKSLSGISEAIIQHINRSNAIVVAVDLPSGLALEHSSLNQPVIAAHFTLTFQSVKKALLLQENALFVGEVDVINIGLHPDFLLTTEVTQFYLEEKNIRKLFKPKQRFAHKGTFGHAMIIAGGWGKMGAAVLASNACLRSGAGLTTAVVPKCGYAVLQTTLPEVMVQADEKENELSIVPAELEKITAIGVGPGIGSNDKAVEFLRQLIENFRKPMVVDADALNCLAKAPELLKQLPPLSILTPHPKEFERLFGKHQNDFERTATALKKARELNLIIVFKGHHTMIALPDGRSYYNSTGNAGMAKGGSGDVLTGILTSLLAQDYAPADAARVGVCIHGWAGDIAAEKFSKQAMTPGNLVGCLSDVFLHLEKPTDDA